MKTTQSILILDLQPRFDFLILFGLEVSADPSFRGLDIEKAVLGETAILLLLPHLPKLLQFHDLIVFGPAVLIAEVINEAVLMLIVGILGLGHLGLLLDLIEHYLDEDARLIVVQVTQLNTSFQVLLDLTNHLLVYFDVRFHQLLH